MFSAKLANGHMSYHAHQYHSLCLLALYYKAAHIETVTQSRADHCQSFVDTDAIALQNCLSILRMCKILVVNFQLFLLSVNCLSCMLNKLGDVAV